MTTNEQSDDVVKYTYPMTQHRAALIHATGIQKAGGLAMIKFDEHLGLTITPLFARDLETKTDWRACQGTSRKDEIYDPNYVITPEMRRSIKETFKSSQSLGADYLKRSAPPMEGLNGMAYLFGLIAVTSITSCSYNVAPKSTSEIFSLGTVFAALGIKAVATGIKNVLQYDFHCAHRNQMVKNALQIFAGNQQVMTKEFIQA